MEIPCHTWFQLIKQAKGKKYKTNGIHKRAHNLTFGICSVVML